MEKGEGRKEVQNSMFCRITIMEDICGFNLSSFFKITGNAKEDNLHSFLYSLHN